MVLVALPQERAFGCCVPKPQKTSTRPETWKHEIGHILDTRLAHLRSRTVTRLSSFHQPHQIGVIEVTNLDQFLHAKKRLKPKGTCSLQFLSWRLITLDNFKLLTTPQFGGIRSSQEESDGIVVSAHQFSGLLAVFGLTRWANSLWTATDILVPLKGTYPLRMRHQPECAYASLKKMPLVLRFWDIKLICLIHPDIPDTVCQYAFFEVLDFRIFLAQPVGAETATQAALVTRPMFALRSETFGRSTSQEKLRDGRQTWPNIGKIIYEKNCIYTYTWTEHWYLKNMLDYPSLSFNCSHPCRFVVLVSSFSQQKKHTKRRGGSPSPPLWYCDGFHVEDSARPGTIVIIGSWVP